MSDLIIKNVLCLDFPDSQFFLGETVSHPIKNSNANLRLLPYLLVLTRVPRIQETDDVTFDETLWNAGLY